MKEIVSYERIQKAVDKIAKKIPESDDMIYLGVLDGCIPFMTDLMMRTEKEIEIKTVRFNSYFGTKNRRVKNVKFDYPLDVFHNKDVVIVDDIFDSGNTIRELTSQISKYAKNVYWCCLLKRRSVSMDKKKLIPGAITINNKDFVIGYGMDYCGKYRNLKGIYKWEEKCQS